MTISLRDKITSGRTVVGTWISIPDIAVVEVLAQAGFDYLLIDGEHAPISPSQLFPLAVAAERRGCPVVYRVQMNSADLIKAALDIGIAGLMVPMVESPEEAAAVVSAAKYPPAGRRGMGPWRASNYFQDFRDYVASANEQTAVIVQIESAAAIEKAAQIAAVPGIDVLYVGPADLSGSLGVPVGTLEPPLLEALKRVVAVGKATGRCVGIDAPSNERLETFAGLGFRLFSFGIDAGYLSDGGRAAAAFAQRAFSNTASKS
jgi:2-keto-3-deoxy-L-rhamnonate aldolase RhmA